MHVQEEAGLGHLDRAALGPWLGAGGTGQEETAGHCGASHAPLQTSSLQRGASRGAAARGPRNSSRGLRRRGLHAEAGAGTVESARHLVALG